MPDLDAYLATIDRALGVMPDDWGLLLFRQQCRRQRGDLQGAEADRTRLRELGYRES